MATNAYKWNYCSLGGVVRVKIASGEDLAHLGELDPKLWTALSCPVKGQVFDQETLRMLDADGDGKIRVAEVVAAADWITSVIKDRDTILQGSGSVPLSQINTETEHGLRLFNSARQILNNLGLQKEEISVDDTSDSVAIFSSTRFNGDGIITPASTDDETLRRIISACIAQVGSAVDRSGVPGITADHIEQFYAACADYAAWQKAAADDPAVMPFGDRTPQAYAVCMSLKDKMADFFMRCKLIAFNQAAAPALDVPVDRLAALGVGNLAALNEEIAAYPLARPSAVPELPADAVNPAWQPALHSLLELVPDVCETGKSIITEAGWNAVLARFAAYESWLAARKGTAVEALGLEAVQAVLDGNRKDDLLALVASDKALEAEAKSIDEVHKLTHLYRDFYRFLRNYVLFLDFYSDNPDEKAIFEVGQLFIDQRCCHLCLRVEDMGKHSDMASLSGMFLIYCTCTRPGQHQTMDIVAVMTNGNTRRLRPGKNAIFYDRQGQDWEAVVTKIVDNPISVRQAFWRPYRKFAESVAERINKSAQEKDDKVMTDLSNKANDIKLLPAEGETETAKKPPFDIAKFAGIFAAIGLAIGYLASALTGITKFASQHWYNILLLLLALLLCISGPSCFIAWTKLRKRNLGPVLNANGWAINAVVLVNILFGATLTSVARYPHLNLKDPYARKTPLWKKVLLILLVVVLLAVVADFVLRCLTGFHLFQSVGYFLKMVF